MVNANSDWQSFSTCKSNAFGTTRLIKFSILNIPKVYLLLLGISSVTGTDTSFSGAATQISSPKCGDRHDAPFCQKTSCFPFTSPNRAWSEAVCQSSCSNNQGKHRTLIPNPVCSSALLNYCVYVYTVVCSCYSGLENAAH